mgnify:CR=1 FL=1|tara:strand:+ start:2672 stop:3517 length:846 start_codon:yes stop_codon:yes gene_type:complete
MGKTKQKKRNTKKFKKNINKQKVVKKGVREITFVPPSKKFPKLNENIYNYYDNNEILEKNNDDILYIPSYKTLPENIVYQIEKFIKKHPLRRGNCHPTSSLLTLNIEGVETCRGWYSDSIEYYLELLRKEEHTDGVEYFQNVLERVEEERLNGNEWVKLKPFFSDEEEYWVNTKTKEFFMEHSWNIYNGVHFDVLVEYHKNHVKKQGVKTSWKYYRLLEVENKNKLVEGTSFENQQQKLSKLNSYYTGSGKWELYYDRIGQNNFILNENYKRRYTNRFILN